jgi:peptide/nickel transport system substrate-binding protein
MKARWKAGVVAVSAVSVLALVAGCTADAPDDDAPTTIRIGVSPDQISGSYSPDLNLRYALDHKAVFDSLMLEDQNTFELVPSMALGFERSEDWKTVVVTLREGVLFTDGTESTAENLVAVFEAYHGLETWVLGGIAAPYAPTFEATGEYEVTITSDKAMDTMSRGYLRQLLNTVPIVSAATFDDLEASVDAPLASGPYTPADVVSGVSLTLEKNQDYWNADAFPFDTIELTVFADDVAGLNALQNGQIDTVRLTVQLADQAANQGFNITEGNGRFIAMFAADWMGTQGSPLANVLVRQAMAYAFDREAINEQFNLGYGYITSCPYQPGQLEYSDGCEDTYSYDPDRARELMAEAGFADGFAVEMPSTAFLNINQWEPVIQQYLGDIGITVTFKTYETGDYFGSIIGPNNVVFFYAEVFVQATQVFINNSAILNSFDVEDPYIEERWIQMQNGPDEVARTAAVELGQYVVDQAILVPFTAPNYIWASADGFTATPGNSGENMLVQNFGVS